MHVQTLISQGENAAVEFEAQAMCPDTMAKALVAFANSGGGAIICGVSDDGEIEGGVDADTFEEWVANLSRNNVIPPIVCDTHVETVSGKTIGVVRVPKGKVDILPALKDGDSYS